MGMTKYQKTESQEVLTPDEHRQVESNLHDINKTSARDLNEQERQEVFGEKQE